MRKPTTISVFLCMAILTCSCTRTPQTTKTPEAAKAPETRIGVTFERIETTSSGGDTSYLIEITPIGAPSLRYSIVKVQGGEIQTVESMTAHQLTDAERLTITRSPDSVVLSRSETGERISLQDDVLSRTPDRSGTISSGNHYATRAVAGGLGSESIWDSIFFTPEVPKGLDPYSVNWPEGVIAASKAYPEWRSFHIAVELIDLPPQILPPLRIHEIPLKSESPGNEELEEEQKE